MSTDTGAGVMYVPGTGSPEVVYVTTIALCAVLVVLLRGKPALVFARVVRLPSTREILWMVFLASVPWLWLHLYNKAVAVREAELARLKPNECDMVSHRGVLQAVVSFLGGLVSVQQADSCVRFYRAVYVTPLWSVPPVNAVLVTAVRLLVEPVEYAGLAMNRCIVALMTGLPVAYQMWLLAVLSVFGLLALFVAFGYRLSVFGLLVLEPVARSSKAVGGVGNGVGGVGVGGGGVALAAAPVTVSGRRERVMCLAIRLSRFRCKRGRLFRR